MITKTKINIQGMVDERSAHAVTAALLDLGGVANVVVDLSGQTADIEYDSEQISVVEFMNRLEPIGFDVV